MKNISRRNFIHALSLFPVAGSLLTHSGGVDASYLIDKKTMFELIQVSKQWQINETIPPAVFLAKRGIDIQDKTEISRMSQQDFKTGNLFEVRGLVLAKTEAAVFALLAEKLPPI